MERKTNTVGLSPEESANYRKIRAQIKNELPELVERHHQRMEMFDDLANLVKQLRVARESLGMTVEQLAASIGVTSRVINDLEMCEKPNPTVDLLVRYTAAIDYRINFGLCRAVSKE